MRLSARNKLVGKIMSVDVGLITASVIIDLGNGQIITSLISKESVDELKLKAGIMTVVIIKSTEIILGV